MRFLEAAVTDLLAERRGVKRNLVWLTGRDRSDNSIEHVGFWNGKRTRSIEVIDGFTGSTVTRTFHGSRELIQMSEISLVADVTVREVSVVLAPLTDEVATALQAWDPRGQPIQIYHAFIDPTDRTILAPPRAVFVGFVDRNPVVVGEGENSSATLVCVSHTRELTRSSPAVRSSEWAHKRDATDDFYKFTAGVIDWEIHWGEKTGGPTTENRKGLFGGFFRRLFTGQG